MVTLFCAIVGEKGSAFSVDIDASQSVDQLKDAIAQEKKYDFAADELELYLAKKGESWLTENEVKNSVRDISNFVPLDVSRAPLNIVGLSENDVYYQVTVEDNKAKKVPVNVLVVVPSQKAAQDVFNRCKHPFFSQFPMAHEVKSWLEFPSLEPPTKLPKFYIRSSYRSIATQALSKADPSMVKYAVITGTPGIGKSLFMYYVMWKLIKEKKRVLFFSIVGPIYFDGSAMMECEKLPSQLEYEFWSSDLWCLMDSVDPTSIAGLSLHECSVLLASTPRWDYISEFKKFVPTPVVLYMPLWTKEELSTIAFLYPDANKVWVNRFNCLGGVPRLVLQDIQTDPQVLLTWVCNSCSLDDCIMLVSIYSEMNSVQTFIDSQEPYQKYEVVYASELAVQVIARTKWQMVRAKMQNFLGSCENGVPLAQSLCGYTFESYAMDLLERGGKFVCRKLHSGAEMQKLHAIKRRRGTTGNKDEEEISIPRSLQCRQIVERVDVGQVANQLYVPRTWNYTAIDAWMPHVGGFQMTVGKKHDIKGGAATDLAKLGENGNRLYFLLPPQYYHSFTKKTPQTIEQYAILIPYPEDHLSQRDLTYTNSESPLTLIMTPHRGTLLWYIAMEIIFENETSMAYGTAPGDRYSTSGNHQVMRIG
ncbi:putative P-loop containing nucleoside triphosphate hydrolase [Plasmopara halstedii]